MSSSLSVVLFLLTFYFLLYFTFLFFLFMANSRDSMNLNTLCNSANVTFVTFDDCLPDTACALSTLQISAWRLTILRRHRKMPQSNGVENVQLSMDGKTVHSPELGEKIIAIPKVYVDDDLSLVSMPLVEGKCRRRRANRRVPAHHDGQHSQFCCCAGKQSGQTIVPIHTLQIPASFSGFQDTSKAMFCVNLLSTAPSVRWTESAARLL